MCQDVSRLRFPSLTGWKNYPKRAQFFSVHFWGSRITYLKISQDLLTAASWHSAESCRNVSCWHRYDSSGVLFSFFWCRLGDWWYALHFIMYCIQYEIYSYLLKMNSIFGWFNWQSSRVWPCLAPFGIDAFDSTSIVFLLWYSQHRFFKKKIQFFRNTIIQVYHIYDKHGLPCHTHLVADFKLHDPARLFSSAAKSAAIRDPPNDRSLGRRPKLTRKRRAKRWLLGIWDVWSTPTPWWPVL